MHWNDPLFVEIHKTPNKFYKTYRDYNRHIHLSIVFTY
jgi:hypothetical protein